MTRGPEEAAAELRELTREANGAVKDLRQVLREARELRARMAAEAEQLLEDRLNAHMDEINGALNDAAAHVQQVITSQEQATREHYAKVLGVSGQKLVSVTCAQILHLAMPEVTVADWLARLARDGERCRNAGCSCLGCVTLTRPGGVRVVTDPADALPGSVIIDLREPGGSGTERARSPGS